MSFSRPSQASFDPLYDTEIHYEDLLTLMESISIDDEILGPIEEELFSFGMAFAIEQSCDDRGRLRPLAERRSWLQQFSRQLAHNTETLLDRLPRRDRQAIAWLVCWAVRLDRARTTGSAILQVPEDFWSGTRA